MPNGTEFPKFPTVFGEDEQERLEEIKKKKAQMEEVYRTKFAPGAPSPPSLPEQAIRGILPEWTSGIVGAMLPWEWGWDYGFTREQVEKNLAETEEEYKELVRAEKVTRLYPQIEKDLMVMALQGSPITTTEELMSMFPELQNDFTEEEIGYLAGVGQQLAMATPEQILAGDLPFLRGEPLAFTEEDWDRLAKQPTEINPEYILSTVAFSKDVEAIGEALQLAYPPSADVDRDKLIADTRERLFEYFKQLEDSLGISPQEATKEAIKKAHEVISEEEGNLLTLRDSETGESFVVTRRGDYVWLGDEIFGFYDEEAGKVYSVDVRTAEPLKTQDEEEGFLETAWEAMQLGSMSLWSSTQKGAHVALEGWINFNQRASNWLNDFLGIEGSIWGEEYAKERKAFQDSVVKRQQEKVEELDLQFKEWLVEHPDLVPKQEYMEGSSEHPELWTDPNWYAHVIFSNAPQIIGALGIGIATGVATANPFIGAAAGAAIITPAQIGEVYDDLIAAGADPSNASELALGTGVVIGGIEVLPGMIAIKSMSPLFTRVFRKQLSKELSKNVVRNLGAKGMLLTAAKIDVSEALEEGLQTAVQNAVVATIDETRGIFDNVPRSTVEAMIAMMPTAIFGGGAEYMAIKLNLAEQTRQKLDKAHDELVKAGLSEEHAEAVAVAQLVETEEGRAEVSEAREVEERKPSKTQEKKDAKVKELESKLVTVNEDIQNFTSNLETHKERLSKFTAAQSSERADAQESIANIEGLLTELNTRKESLENSLRNQKKVVIQKERATVERATGEEKLFTKEQVSEERKSWGEMPYAEKLEAAATAGIAKTAAEKTGGELTERQVELLLLAKQETTQQEQTAEPVEPVATPVRTRITDTSKRPRMYDWKDEQQETAETLAKNPELAAGVVFPTEVTEARAKAEKLIVEAQTKLKEAIASNDEETANNLRERLKKIAKALGLKHDLLLAKDWADLTPSQRHLLALAAIQDSSLRFNIVKEVFDMRYYFQFLEEDTGQPFYALFKRAEFAHGAARIAGEKFLVRIGEDPRFDRIRMDEAALVRVTEEINSRDPTQTVISPEGLTENERLLADVIEAIYQEYQPKIRYLRFMDTDNTETALKEEFPDAPEVELMQAYELRKKDDLDGLWNFLQTCSWGVRESGYDPWIVTNLDLFSRKVKFSTLRGKGRLMRREGVDLPELRMHKNVLQRLASYIKMIEAQWELQPEFEAINSLWAEVGDKYNNAEEVKSVLMLWKDEMQGILVKNSLFDRALRRVWRQAMSAIFLHPWMAFRNVHQLLAFHPDRTELLRLGSMSPELKNLANIYYDAFVSQLKGIRRDWLYTGERGLPGFTKLTALADKLSLYAHSDNIPRKYSFMMSTNKAKRAISQYRKDGNLNKLIKDSGAIHLRQTERNYFITLLTRPKHDLAVPGLRQVSGDDIAALYIGQEVANMTHFVYERAFRAPVELGASGRIIYNLIVFPRGYAQRVFLQGQKVFSKEGSWAEKRAGFKDIVLLMIAGTLISEWLRDITGKKRRAYYPFDIIQWELGGLAIGAAVDLGNLVWTTVRAFDMTRPEEERLIDAQKLPALITSNLDTFVPFYRILADSADAISDYRNFDTQGFRHFVSTFFSQWTPEELDKMERNLYERFQRGFFGGEVADPTAFEKSRMMLAEKQGELGTAEADGRAYTLRDFAGVIREYTKGVPDSLISEEAGFSELVVFYKDCESAWEELETIPSNKRDDWRREHIEEEAMLLFWGRYSRSVFSLNSREWKEVRRLLQIWAEYYGIDWRMHEKFADWTILTPGS